MELSALTAICPVDGRYWDDVAGLSPFFSEFALMKKRLEVELQYLLALESLGITTFSDDEKSQLKGLYESLSLADVQVIKDIETKGVVGINGGKKSDHDVKSLEFFVGHKLKGTSLETHLSMFHFCLTSEDINNLAYSSLLQEGVR